jgi:uncharacterized protein HemY
MNSQTGKQIILIGVVIILVGIIIYFFHKKLTWIGKLPGDIRIEKENFRLYFPVTTLLLTSLILTLLLRLIRWLK